jgi:RNA polymerase sigma-70 factor, ECF subfamily
VKREEILHTDLIHRIKQGDQSAFELLFKLYHTPLCNYAKVYVKHIEIADDIVQETFIRIWELRSGLDPSQSLKAYL